MNNIPQDVIKIIIAYTEPTQFINFFQINKLDFSMKFKYTMTYKYEYSFSNYEHTKYIFDFFPNIITEYTFVTNYFNTVCSGTNIPSNGIYTYSFSLYPEQCQPSGCVNLSRIDLTSHIKY